MTATPTRQRILDTALELFNRHGYAATSLAAIAAAAGIRQGNLTYHFPTKLDLVAANEPFDIARQIGDDHRIGRLLSRCGAPHQGSQAAQCARTAASQST